MLIRRLSFDYSHCQTPLVVLPADVGPIIELTPVTVCVPLAADQSMSREEDHNSVGGHGWYTVRSRCGKLLAWLRRTVRRWYCCCCCLPPHLLDKVFFLIFMAAALGSPFVFML